MPSSWTARAFWNAAGGVHLAGTENLVPPLFADIVLVVMESELDADERAVGLGNEMRVRSIARQVLDVGVVHIWHDGV